MTNCVFVYALVSRMLAPEKVNSDIIKRQSLNSLEGVTLEFQASRKQFLVSHEMASAY